MRHLHSAATLRAARELLGLSQREVAERAGVAASTLHVVERDNHPRNDASRQRIQEALEAAGIEFIPAVGDRGSGVMYARRSQELQVAANEAKAAESSRLHRAAPKRRVRSAGDDR
jgi:transcriptional regulator with XRE-family HTH domain